MKTQLIKPTLEKVTQEALNVLVKMNSTKNPFNMKMFLKREHFNNDLSGMYIDVSKISSTAIDFSTLDLSGAKIYNISANIISFRDTQLTGAHIAFIYDDQSRRVNFSRAKLVNSFLYGIEIFQMIMRDTNMKNTMILGTSYNSLDYHSEVVELILSKKFKLDRGRILSGGNGMKQICICSGLLEQMSKQVMDTLTGEKVTKGGFLDKLAGSYLGK